MTLALWNWNYLGKEESLDIVCSTNKLNIKAITLLCTCKQIICQQTTEPRCYNLNSPETLNRING